MTVLYSNNFDSDTTGSISPSWQAKIGTWQVGTSNPVSGTKTFGSTTLTDGQVSNYQGISALADMVVQYSQKVSRIADGAATMMPIVRSDSTYANAYLAIISPISTSQLTVKTYKRVSSSYTLLNTSTISKAFAVNDTMWVEMSAIGTAIGLKIWNGSGSKPLTSDISLTDSSVTAAGYGGLYYGVNVTLGNPASAIGADDYTVSNTTPSQVFMTGPTGGVTGVASSSFTVNTDGVITGTVVVTPSDSGVGGSFSPTTVSLTSGSPSATFTYTPASVGNKTISVINNASLSNPGSITYNVSAAAATAVTMSRPGSGYVGLASTSFTVGANGSITGTIIIMPSDGGAGGSFTPSTVSISSGSPTATFTYTAGWAGVKTISAANNASMTNPSTITYTASSAPASSITLTGPTSGVTGVASTSFTVGANGVITGTVVVTPSDGGAGGAFSPATISISSGSLTGTFTYTPASLGNKTISVTNNGSLSNPATIIYNSLTNGGYAVDNAYITWSPYNWDTLAVNDYGVSTKSMQTSATGAYMKFAVSNTTAITLKIDVSTLGTPFGASTTPLLMYSIGNGPAQTVQLPTSGTTLSLATGLTTSNTYDVQLWYFGSAETVGDRWGSVGNAAGNSPTNVVRINGIQLDSAGVLAAHSFQASKKALFFGDSITAGVRAARNTTQPGDHDRSYAWFTATALNAEYGVVGYGATGWARTGNGNMPIFPTHWNYYSNGRARSFSPQPDYVFVMHSTNDTRNGISDATIQAALITWLGNARAAFPNAYLFIVVPPGGFATAGLAGGVNQYAATSNDRKAFYLNFSDRLPTSGLTTIASATYQAVDDLHPDVQTNARIGASVALLAQKAMDGTGTGVPKSGVNFKPYKF